MDHPALKWDARYGRNLLAQHEPEFGAYAAITTPSAWAVAEPQLSNAAVVEFHQGMADTYLDDVTGRLPPIDRIVAVGGGNALDVGKYVAHKLSKPLVLIPTIVSTGAIFQAGYVVRNEDGSWESATPDLTPDYVLVDYDVVRQAPPHLNAAGMGETIGNMALLAAWRWWDGLGRPGEPWDQAVADDVADWVRDQVRRFAADMDVEGRAGDEAIRMVAEAQRDRYRLPTFGKDVYHSIDHPFGSAFERIHGRELIHAEAVALGTLLTCFVCEWGFDEAKQMLDACRTRYKPLEIRTTYDEARAAVEGAASGGPLGPGVNWFSEHDLDDDLWRRMMAAVDA